MNKIKKLIFDERIEYLFWGVLTTLVYLVTRLISIQIFTSAFIPVWIAQIVSIAFAFIVNKFFVFNSNEHSKSLIAQILNFISGRLIVFGLDYLLTFIMIDRFSDLSIKLLFLDKINYHNNFFAIGLINKTIGTPVLLNTFICVMLIQILAIVINYLVSKYFAFK